MNQRLLQRGALATALLGAGSSAHAHGQALGIAIALLALWFVGTLSMPLLSVKGRRLLHTLLFAAAFPVVTWVVWHLGYEFFGVQKTDAHATWAMVAFWVLSMAYAAAARKK